MDQKGTHVSLPTQTKADSRQPLESLSPGDSSSAQPEQTVQSTESHQNSRFPSLKTRSVEISPHKVPRKPVPSTTTYDVAPTSPSATHVPRDHGMFHDWWWELGACIIAVAALLAIVATLYSYRGRPLPRLPFGISVNALISIYVVIMKGALVTVIATGIGQLKWTWIESDRPLHDLVVFDQASRGVLGSLSLIWHVHFRQAVVSLGATLVVLMLAVDPFTQQLIQYVGCSEVLAGQVAGVPRTNFFQEVGYHVSAGQSSINTGVQSAVNSGIFAPGSLVDVTCPTGNCTFTKEYGTVGFCSYCKDISHLIEVDVACYNTTTLEVLKCSNETSRNFTSSIPNGISMTFADLSGGAPTVAIMENGFGGDVGKDIPDGVQIMVGKSEFSRFRTVPSTGNPLTDCDNPATNDTWRCRNYGAAACGLSNCVRTYTATMTAGVFHEEQTGQSPYELDWGADDEDGYLHAGTITYGLVDLTCINENEHSNLLKAGYPIQHAQRWLPYNITFDPRQSITHDLADKFPYSMLANHCLYLMDQLFLASLWEEYLTWFFNGTVQGDSEYGATSGMAMVQGPQVLQTIYNYGNVSFDRIDSIFQNISTSMTNYMRQNGNANQSAPVNGDVLHYATCLEVEWGWIAFPAAMVALTSVFCLLTIVTTAVHKSQIWKSSSLAMVYHGPYTRTVASEHGRVISYHDNPHSEMEKERSLDAAAPRSIQSMEAAAGNLIVRLDKQHGKVRISENQIKSKDISNG